MAGPCRECQKLRIEVQAATDALVGLFQRRQSAFLHGHENTLRVLAQQIDRSFAEKDRATGALRKHQVEHGAAAEL